MPKTYFHIFARSRTPDGADGWFHEISLDSREDADVEAYDLRFHGFRVKIAKNSRDPAAQVRELNADDHAKAIR